MAPRMASASPPRTHLLRRCVDAGHGGKQL